MYVQTEQNWAVKLKKSETDKEQQLADKDEQWQRQLRSIQGDAGSAMEQVRAEHAAEMQEVTEAHAQQISAFKVCSIRRIKQVN